MTPYTIAFFDELRRLGFIEGQNLTVEYHAFGIHFDLLSRYATELVKARVDVIVAAGDDAVRAVQQATKTIPIVAIGGDYTRVPLRELVVAAGRQYDGRQYPLIRGLTVNDRTS